MKKTIFLLSVCVALIFSACQDNSEAGVLPQSDPPLIASSEITMNPMQPNTVEFVVSSDHSAASVWRVYLIASGGNVSGTVSASFDAETGILTLHSATGIIPRTYFITVTDEGMAESNRIALIVRSGGNTIPGKPEDTPFLHAQDGVYALHTEADFVRIREKLAAGEEPWVGGHYRLSVNQHAQLTFVPEPVEEIVAGTVAGRPENFGIANRSTAAAYQLALRWKIEEDDAFADHAVFIINEWVRVLQRVTGDTNRSLRAGLVGYVFAIAGEILRSYDGWDPADFAAFQQWLLDVFYTENMDFLIRHHNTYDPHYWANWDLSNLAALLAIGIVTDRRDIYNWAVNYLQNGNGNGNWFKAINYIHVMEDGTELGQNQESGRDQGHTVMVIGLMGVISQLTWNQGDDFYGLDDSRFLKGSEYVAKYNIAHEEVPFAEYTRLWGNITNTGGNPLVMVMTEVAGPPEPHPGRPLWAIQYYHYLREKNMPPERMRYTLMGVEVTRPEGGPNIGDPSGAYDQLGFGTLMYTR